MEFHNRLRKRLRSLSASVTLAFHEQHHNGSDDVLASSSSRKKGQLPLPRTVQEFLSRDPDQVAKDLNVPVTQVKELRIISAQEYLKARSTVDLEYIRDVCIMQNALVGKDKVENHSSIIQDSEQHHDDKIDSLNHQPPPLFTGAVTALDYCIYQSCCSDVHQERSNDPSKRQRCSSANVPALPVSASVVLSTGSTTLNRLISSQPLQVGKLVCPWMDWLSSVVRKCEDVNNNSLWSNPKLVKRTYGLEFGYVTEVEGESSTGKTQIALSLACYAAAIVGVDVTYLVSGGASIISLSRRASKIISSYRNDNIRGSVGTDDNISAVVLDSLQRIHFIPVSDGFTVLATLSRLEHEGETDPNHKLSLTKYPRKLIICDSAQGCFTTNLLGTHEKGGGVSAGSGFISEVSMAFRRHARKTGNAVFITNGMVTASNKNGPLTSSPYKNGLQPALGAEWRASDVRIYLNMIEDCALKRIQATLLRHYSKPIQKLHLPTVTFAISSKGITDIPT